MKGPFVLNDDTDIYDSDTLLQWLIWLIILFYSLVVVFYIGIFINNTTFEHTYTKHPSSPGILSSERYNLYWFVYAITVVVAALFPILAMLMVLFRDTYGCNVVNTIILFLAFAAHLFAFIVLTSAYIQCNHAFSPDNPCNSHLLCCVPSIYTDPVNDCPNVTPCDTGPSLLSELSADPDFLWLYWTNAFFFIFHVVFLGVIVIYWNRDTKNIIERELPQTLKLEEAGVSVGGYTENRAKTTKLRRKKILIN